MLKLGLLGKNIQHSKSPEIYNELFDGQVEYSLLDINDEKDIPQLEEIFSNLQGLSITAPYKKHFLNDVSLEESVKEIGAINCIKYDGTQFFGTNTDYLAAKEIILNNSYEQKEIVMLGDGAMTNMFKVLFKELNINYHQFSRKKNGDLNSIKYDSFVSLDKALIINCCARQFQFNSVLSKNSIFWDMNYSHEYHQSFLSNKLTYVDGSELLYLQAVEAKKFWNFTL
ncbi:hypothetical protein ACRXCV_01940 [Halobacteriovorax sp. GFR7]|uniref:hypothetical protein n=1 Tax=unclassified Halobacteriovorax TaxID=2639665 RepID=UPI003D97626F